MFNINLNKNRYRLVENSHTLYIMNHSIFFLITIHTDTYHSKPQSLNLSCLCLLFHIALSYLIVSFSIFPLLTWYSFIISYSSIPSLLQPLYIYKVHSNNTCFSVSTSPHLHLSSSYFHFIPSLPLIGKHHPLTISLTPSPTFPSAKLSVSLKPFSILVCQPPLFYCRCASSRILIHIHP